MEEIKDLINKGKDLQESEEGKQDTAEDLENQLDSFEKSFLKKIMITIKLMSHRI